MQGPAVDVRDKVCHAVAQLGPAGQLQRHLRHVAHHDGRLVSVGLLLQACARGSGVSSCSRQIRLGPGAGFRAAAGASGIRSCCHVDCCVVGSCAAAPCVRLCRKQQVQLEHGGSIQAHRVHVDVDHVVRDDKSHPAVTISYIQRA